MKHVNVKIGGITLGQGYGVAVQSMTNTPTSDVEATVAQIERLAAAGCEMVRITVPALKNIEHFAQIKQKVRSAGVTTYNNIAIPLIADVHYLPEVALRCAEIADKVRINPGNYVDRPEDVNTPAAAMKEKIAERLQPLTEICKKHNTALRIGVNQGSLSKRILSQAQQLQNQAANAGSDQISTIDVIKEQALILSALEFTDACEALQFENTVYSIKSSDVTVMVHATERLYKAMLERETVYPLHIGVTEAGNGQDGRIISAAGIGSLLLHGIGNTIRVSLTEKPENEIPVARAILQACGLGSFTTRFVACPSCGRTQYDIETVLEKIKARFGNYPNIKIAVMGCVVNGPGEMGDADYGYIGGAKGVVNLYRKGQLVKTGIPEKEALDELEKLL
ncbi:MAG: (E)-4-hydroxy-3-methylbut-2-enyl-diphosphate synthase [Bacteroidales bacterium]|jgi:(E)-4-hydroxy-3-methylbut-2-enyl-diphosphate synthase|nr:(E)-4-hydroxy-3-methylbut-2-enyl-diphosphate synthase [Bacteroidales bacterium]